MFGDPNFVYSKSLLTDAFDIRDDLRKPLNDGIRKEMKTGELYPYFGANGKADEINDYLIDDDILCIAEDCGAYGSNEQTAYEVNGKCWINNHAHVLMPKNNNSIKYAYWHLYLQDLKEYINGTTRQKLTRSSLERLPFILPSVEKQCEFEQYAIHLDKSKVVLKKCIKRLIYRSKFYGK